MQVRKIFPLKFITQDMDWEEEPVFGTPYPAVCSQAAAGNDAMHMHMIRDLLVPGMEDLYDPGECTQIFLVPAEFQKSFCTAFVEKRIEGPLVAVKERVQFMGKRKDHMEIRRVDDFRTPLVYPDFF